LAEQIYRAAKPLIEKEVAAQRKRGSEARFRLIGVGIDGLCDASEADLPDLFAESGAEGKAQLAKVERAMDEVRSRFGVEAIIKGRGLRGRR
jgi:DNA polymerase-4